MKLIVTEKNIAAQKLSEILAQGSVASDKVYNTPIYRFKRDGEDWAAIGLRGHILEVDFPASLNWSKSKGWQGVDSEGSQIKAKIPASLPQPPFPKKRPYSGDSVDLGQWNMAVLPYLTYAPLIKYPKEKEIIRALKNLAHKSDAVIIATDFDREGELIGYDAMGLVLSAEGDKPISRMRYSAITKAEIEHAFANQLPLDVDLALAGESRQHIDLIWGAVLTRYLTVVKRAGMGKARSAGRVQTPTLALVAQRERERLAFVPEDYWVIKGRFSAQGEEFSGSHEADRFKDEASAQAAMKAIAAASCATVKNVERKSRTVAPPVPFNTTSLQAAAAAEGLSPARTMRIAETLYMNGLTSYPRVDNTVYPASLDLAGVVKTLSQVPNYAPYCKKLLAKGTLTASRGKQESTDHPPIYPTGAGDPSKLKPEEWKLYNLIARRFLATLSDAAVLEGSKISLDVSGEGFIARGDVLVKAGFREIYPYGLKKDETLPALEAGQLVDFLGAELQAKQTEPPARYSQGKLIQKMEECGLGTKATRHSIIERLYEVQYIVNDPIEPTALGLAICDALEQFAPHITSPTMTAELEEGMNAIAAGTSSQEKVVEHSRALLAEILDELLPRKEEMGAAIADAVAADSKVGICPKCGKDLLLKSSPKTRSNFVGCAGWPDCDVTYPLPQGKIETHDQPCSSCGGCQIKVSPFRAKAYIHCLDPLCPSNAEPDLPLGPCPVCAASGLEGQLLAQRSPRSLKRFVRCSEYERCGCSMPLPQKGKLAFEGELCEACGYPVVLIDNGRKEPWHLCINGSCPAKEQNPADKPAKKGAARKAPAKKAGSKKTSSKS